MMPRQRRCRSSDVVHQDDHQQDDCSSHHHHRSHDSKSRRGQQQPSADSWRRILTFAFVAALVACVSTAIYETSSLRVQLHDILRRALASSLPSDQQPQDDVVNGTTNAVLSLPHAVAVSIDGVAAAVSSDAATAVVTGALEALFFLPIAAIVPLTHLSGKMVDDGYRFFQPLRGGASFISLQASAWCIYTLALITTACALFWLRDYAGLLTSSGLLSLWAQGLMVSSLMCFQRPAVAGNSGASPRAEKKENEGIVRRTNLTHFTSMALALMFSTFVVCFIFSCRHLDRLSAFLALIATLSVPALTHGIGGTTFVRGWRFYHPFSGGRVHVFLQATGWLLVALGLFCQLGFFLGESETGNLGERIDGRALIGCSGVFALGAELFLAASLWSYQSSPGAAPTAAPAALPTAVDGFHLAVSFVQDIVLTNLHWFSIFHLLLTARFGPPLWFHPYSFRTAVLVTLAPHAIPYTASRRYHRFQAMLFHGEGMWRGARIRISEPLPTYRSNCMFGFSPHGTYPVSVWALTYRFNELFHDTCIFFGSQAGVIPLFRLFIGARGGGMPVTKGNLRRTMKTGRNVGLVPGGIHEMMQCQPDADAINVSVKHKGFVRLAVEQGYDLVPVLNFAENDLFCNPFQSFQLYCYRAFKVPSGIPFFANRWWFPISNRVRLQVAVGRRIRVGEACAEPEEDRVERLHRQYYEEVSRLFDAHKAEFGFEGRTLNLVG